MSRTKFKCAIILLNVSSLLFLVSFLAKEIGKSQERAREGLGFILQIAKRRKLYKS
jgi:hypothetical protein